MKLARGPLSLSSSFRLQPLTREHHFSGSYPAPIVLPPSSISETERIENGEYVVSKLATYSSLFFFLCLCASPGCWHLLQFLVGQCMVCSQVVKVALFWLPSKFFCSQIVYEKLQTGVTRKKPREQNYKPRLGPAFKKKELGVNPEGSKQHILAEFPGCVELCFSRIPKQR